MRPDRDQREQLQALDDAVTCARADHASAVRAQTRAAQRTRDTHDVLYAVLRRRQQVRHSLRETYRTDRPIVPCRDCLNEIAIVNGAGSHEAGYIHHEIIYDGDELPYATCGTCG